MILKLPKTETTTKTTSEFCNECGTIRHATDVCPLTGRDDCPDDIPPDAAVTCMCGSYIKDHTMWDGHSPVSMLDYHRDMKEGKK